MRIFNISFVVFDKGMKRHSFMKENRFTTDISLRVSKDDGWPVDDSLADVSFILNKDPGDETDEDQANDEEAVNSASIFKPSWTELIENGQIDLTELRKYGGGPKHNLPVASEAGEYFKMLFTNDMCDKFVKTQTNMQDL
ncbi:hypothetical protein AVEN_257263-1 [Araneus ventricosus]|uniref:Uncharacterized protein n=1 Tax=Araneus ventricosus TaxID=182803 RepID=A0A4Y2HBJ2_ARAVE|nr:hypothetical protein AVEN_257263-1 [Araneus ventricosus]